MNPTARQTDHAMLLDVLRDDMPGIKADMADRGYEITTIETWRHPLRAEMLQGRGSSKNGDRSFHCLVDEHGNPESYAVDIGNARGVGKPGSKREGKIDWWSDWERDPETGLIVKRKFTATLEDVAIARGWFRIFSPGVNHQAGDADAESWDGPHVQAIPVRLQNRVRRMRPADRRDYVHEMRRKFLAGYA